MLEIEDAAGRQLIFNNNYDTILNNIPGKYNNNAQPDRQPPPTFLRPGAGSCAPQRPTVAV